jgi:hypothetical protein
MLVLHDDFAVDQRRVQGSLAAPSTTRLVQCLPRREMALTLFLVMLIRVR